MIIQEAIQGHLNNEISILKINLLISFLYPQNSANRAGKTIIKDSGMSNDKAKNIARS